MKNKYLVTYCLFLNGKQMFKNFQHKMLIDDKGKSEKQIRKTIEQHIINYNSKMFNTKKSKIAIDISNIQRVSDTHNTVDIMRQLQQQGERFLFAV